MFHNSPVGGTMHHGMRLANKPKKKCVSVCYAVVLPNEVIVRFILNVVVAVKSITLFL